MLGPDTKMGFLLKPLLFGGLLLASLALAGCSGDDGSAGAAGPSAYQIAVANGFTGTEAEWLEMITGTGTPKTAEVETCAVCHNDVAVTHAATGVTTVSAPVAALDVTTGDLEITFNVKLDGVNNDGYGIRTSLRNGVTSATAYVSWADATLVDPALITNYVRTQFPLESTTWIAAAGGGTGNYTITVPAVNVIPNATYLFRLANPSLTGDTQPVVVATYGTTHLRDLVTDSGCAKCHGDFPAWSEKFKHYAVGGSKCQVCHSQATRDTTFNTRTSATTFTTAGPIFGTNLTEYIHGIHNSHNMPDGTYYRTMAVDGASNIEDRYSLGFPSSMTNCRVCHTTDAQLTAVAAAPVSYYLCMTCHQNWDGFVHTHASAAGVTPAFKAGDKIMVVGSFLSNLHRPLLPADSCLGAGCHSVNTRDEVADFHNDFQGTDAHYNSYYRGEDISFANNDDVTFAITGVTSNGSAVSFTWTASKLSAPVNPCNTDIATGPTFQGLGAYLAYAKGDDWVNEFVGTSPGQPASSRNLFGTGTNNPVSTTCAANVATTTGLTLNASALAYADKVLLAIGGKPLNQGTFTIGATPTTMSYFVREVSPVYAFDPATGAALPQRRNAVNNDKCLGCHQGSLYQHGGDRVDNEQLCVICHNPSSGDKHNRLNLYQIVNADGTVNTAATYDGKNNETFDMRTMIHAIHGVDKRNDPWVIYRGRGIYAFAPDLYEEVILPGDDEVSTIKVAFPKPTGWPADNDLAPDTEIIHGSTNGSTINHTWTVVHFPRRTNECLACHNDEYVRIPDQTQAVPLTVDPGFDYSSQSDDIVIGPAAAACTACHATAPTKVHATVDFGYRANVTKESMLAKAAQ